MKGLLWPFLFAFVLAGCAAYKELQPDPPILPAERGYIELKNDKEDFELSQGKKYFIKFPPPARDHFKLVLVANAKPAMHAFLTRDFEKKEGPFAPITDETANNDSLFVYAVDPRSPDFSWVIDTVKQDLLLTMRYRYIPEWRYTFEVRYNNYRNTLRANTVDRSTYESITPNSTLNSIDTRRELNNVQNRTEKLQGLHGELESLAQVFPPDIAASQDTAYRDYSVLKDRLADEIDFQENYARVLRIIQTTNGTRGDMSAFVEASPALAEDMSHVKSFPAGAAARMKNIVLARLDEMVPYYERVLSGKTDVGRIDPQPSPEAITALYRTSDRPVPRNVDALLRFVQRFNTETAALTSVRDRFRELDAQLSRTVGSADESFFTSQLARAGQIKQSIPEPMAVRIEHFGDFPAAGRLAQEIANVTGRANDEQTMYETAARTAANVSARAWSATETGLRQLADGSNFSSPSSLAEQRGQIVRRYENELFQEVKQASQQRVDAFAREHETTYENVPALYQDSVFSPVYEITFSSIGQADLANKRKQIGDYLDRIKYIQFPENSIKAIYASFIRNINDRGVEKARAIVDHGKFYRGDDKQVKGLIEECNPNVAKWIMKPKEYRRLFALPVTSNPRGTNEYLFRVGLRIPSEAEFPIFDINIKLPPDVAQKAASEQWFQEITLNKKPIRNEGRFRITAPIAANNYESQISPVQMDKAGNNVLEVRFKYPGYKVLEISTMAQVPLIRKN